MWGGEVTPWSRSVARSTILLQVAYDYFLYFDRWGDEETEPSTKEELSWRRSQDKSFTKVKGTIENPFYYKRREQGVGNYREVSYEYKEYDNKYIQSLKNMFTNEMTFLKGTENVRTGVVDGSGSESRPTNPETWTYPGRVEEDLESVPLRRNP